MEDAKKLCRDCLHCRPRHETIFSEISHHEYVHYDDARCALTDLVTGSGNHGNRCAEERAKGHSCGALGRYFVPIPPKPEKVKTDKKSWWKVY